MRYTGCYSRMEIEAFQPPENSVLICIHDPDSTRPEVEEKEWKHIAYFNFWDVGNENSSHNHGYPAATETDIDKIYKTLHQFSDSHIFASCEAGISRSGAVREFLHRRGFTFCGEAQKNRMVHPNAYILAGLERLDRVST